MRTALLIELKDIAPKKKTNPETPARLRLCHSVYFLTLISLSRVETSLAHECRLAWKLAKEPVALSSTHTNTRTIKSLYLE